MERASDAIHARSFARGTKYTMITTYAANHSTSGIISRQSACANRYSAVPVYTTMYHSESTICTADSRSDVPVCMTRLAMLPAKSFWKNDRLWRTT
ncbi:hypothetical protein D9M71_594770 [compost metagenome]